MRLYIQTAKVHKKSDFLRPVYKKVKTVTIFVHVKTADCSFHGLTFYWDTKPVI